MRANQGAPGGDRQTIASFENNLQANLARLCQNLQQGTYRPGPVRKLSIPKKDGSLRPLCIPSVADRVVQTSMALALSPILEPEMEDVSFAYRPGRSVQMAVDRVARHYREGYRWVVDADIDDYFDSVPHDRLLEVLRRYVRDEPFLRLVGQWLAHGAAGGAGLPQGSPLSPLLANIYLDDIDELMRGNGVRVVRFADDFVFLCKSQGIAHKAAEKAGLLLKERGLTLHPIKTRVASFDEGFDFLGRIFVRSVILRQKHRPQEPECDTAGDEPQTALAAANEPPSKPVQKIPDPAPPRSPPEGPTIAEAGPDEPRATSSHASSPPDSEEDPAGLAPCLRVLYVTGQGRVVLLRNRALSVKAWEGPDAPELLAVLPARLDRLELWPGVEMCAAALRFALAHGLEVAFVNGWGETKGVLRPTLPEKAGLHLAQAGMALDPQKRADMARRIVQGRLRNQRALLRRLNRKRKDPAVAGHAASIGEIIKRLPREERVQGLMGQEGQAAKHHWAALGLLLEPKWGFEGRERRPPGDPINLVISFTSWMLYRDMHCMVLRHGLHPGFGALHGCVDGRPGCVSDLIEEFRAPLCEGLAVYLANNHVIKPHMFQPGEERPVEVTPEGRDRIVRGYEAWLDRAIRSPRDGKRVKWRRLVEEQVLAYRGHVLGQEEYRPYLMDH